MGTKTCKSCGLEKPYHKGEKQHSKASGFMMGRCWACFKLTNNLRNKKNRATPEGRAKHNASSVKSIVKRLKTDAWYRLRVQLAKETNLLVKSLIKGEGTDYKCQLIFGQDRETVLAHFNSQLATKNLGRADYQFAWQVDHRVPVALAQTDVELRQLFLLSNVQVLTTEEHLAKSILDTALVKNSQA